ncbi:unnamed protein product [Spirodela intermedia]|uniref:Uncharacterized protein n=1 Tax=Spirodela intermedia TaxID=51605 RepID=A0A7I8IN30_SPIIN|nr:unnamed protein product [Spirodela intermedia]CAA6658364.1 unnamed protein product [Spirodela intermedia]
MLPFLVSLLLAASTAAAPISRSKYLRDGETVLSARQIFEMGFFSPGSSKKRYLGIWFKNPQPQAVVWVANREKPLDNSTGVLLIDERGRLLLLDRQDGEPSVAELLDSGNLVLRDSEKGLPQGLLWQSIEDPDHVMLPGMRIMAGRYLTSWKSPNDPSPGMYTFKMDFTILPRLLMYEGSRLRYSTGHFNGFRFIGVPYMQPNPIVLFIVETTGDQADYRFEMNTNTTVSILNLSPTACTWKSFTYSPVDECDRFANCGAFGICNMSTFPVCGCLEGYAPRNPGEWNNQNTSSGCLKLPHLINVMVNRNMTLQECRHKCAEDCSCKAYASANVTDDRGGCITWLGDLLDIRILDTKVQDLYIRVPASSLGTPPHLS